MSLVPVEFKERIIQYNPIIPPKVSDPILDLFVNASTLAAQTIETKKINKMYHNSLRSYNQRS